MRRFRQLTFGIVLRIVAVLAVAGAVVYVAARAVVPSGTLTVSTDLRSPAPFVSEPKPSERLGDPVTAAGRTFVPLQGEPVYLDLDPPSSFEKVDVTVTYRNTGHGLVDVGALSSSVDDLYDMRPVEDRLLDGLNWDRVSSGDLTLLQRSGTYASVDEFLRDPPPLGKIAVFHATAPVPYRIDGYRPAGASREITVSLRGSHRLLAYTDGEPVSFRFTVQDMNRQDGADPVIVTMYREGDASALSRTVLADDGDTTDDQHSSPLRDVSVSLADPAPGVYAVDFTSPADVFIRSIRTTQSKLVFADHLYLGDHVGYSDTTPPLTVYTTGARLTARTAHVGSLQTLSVGSKRLELREPNARYSAWTGATAAAPVAVTTPERDVLLETDGVFALSPSEAFDPRPFGLSWYTDADALKARGIDYVLTSYAPPSRDGDLVTATTTFDLKDLARTSEGKYRFAIAAPGMEETQRSIDLANVTFTLRRDATGWADGIRRLFSAPSGPQQPTAAPNGTSFGEQVP